MSAIRAVAGSLRTMTYDPLDRLATAVAAGRWGARSYSYDALGNRRSRGGGQVASYSYDDQNRLSFVTGASGLAPMRLAWSEAGRLAGTSDGASYRYDGHGRRVEKAEASGRTVYHLDAAGRVIAETAPEGTGLREYYYLGNQLLAVKGCVSGGCGEVEWYHTDALGSVVARTGGSGAVVMARLEYEPWGEQWTSSGVAGDRQYNGRVYDPGTGFHDYGARLYWPEIGRFVSADSVTGNPASPASLNRYSYVLNNPYKWVDPTGNAVAPPGAQAAANANRQALASALATLQDPDASFLSKVVAVGKGALAALGVVDPIGVAPAVVEIPAAAPIAARLLQKSLASEAQAAELMAGGGKAFAGAGTHTPIDDIARLVAEYGGAEADWAKVTSSTFKREGVVVETHAYRNVKTGSTVELKSKLPEPRGGASKVETPRPAGD